MAAVLGGTQSFHTNSVDETLALPTEKAVRIALRTQQILAFESGVQNTIDPLAGSYYVETLTDRLETEALEVFDRIVELGGVVPGIEEGFFQMEIAESARRQQADVESSRSLVVGMNEFTEGSENVEIDTLKIDPSVEERQRQRMADLRDRDDAEVARALEELEGSCGEGTNVVARHPGLCPGRMYALRDSARDGEDVWEL